MSALSTADPDDDAEMFDLAPVSLWIEDYSAVRALFEQWRAEGVGDIEAFLAPIASLKRSGAKVTNMK